MLYSGFEYTLNKRKKIIKIDQRQRFYKLKWIFVNFDLAHRPGTLTTD